jgi:transcriptional regulator with XRE-family HTH domain
MLKPAPSEPQRQQIGSALRARRQELGLTMQAVADAAGLSVGFISQVERDLTAPSLSSLASLAEVLQTPMGAFLTQPEMAGGTTRRDDRATYSVDASGPSYERLSTKFPGSQLCSVIFHEPPGHRSEPISHRGEEMFFVLAGEVTVEIEGKIEILRPGRADRAQPGRGAGRRTRPGKASDYADSILMFNVYDTLVLPTQGAPGCSRIWRTGWEIDGNDFIFTLRDDVTFQSGNPMTPRMSCSPSSG